jgi:hypothetical protein
MIFVSSATSSFTINGPLQNLTLGISLGVLPPTKLEVLTYLLQIYEIFVSKLCNLTTDEID